MSKIDNENVSIDALSFSKDSVLLTDSEIYKIDLLDDTFNFIFTSQLTGDEDSTIDTDFDTGVAYIYNGYYFLYRGEHSGSKLGLKPGIYRKKSDSKSERTYFIISPSTDEEKAMYDITDKICSLHKTSIIDTANTKEELLVAIPESSKIFKPTLAPTDDILKRAAKLVLLAKGVDLDRHKDGFRDKNALFNLKQVFRGDSKVSILIFDRFCEAMNLEYAVVISEKNDPLTIGTKLDKPIIVSSEDTYDI